MILLRACSLFLLITAIGKCNGDEGPKIPNPAAVWRAFVEKYYKSYENSTEEKFRKEIFSKNWDLILKCNEDYKRNNQNFSCTVNEFADLTDEEFEQSFANLPKELLSFPSVGYRKNKRYKRQDIPVSVDWRNTAVTPVKYQGLCGSCWTFASAAALEAQLFMKTGELVSLSEQNLLDCVTAGSGCLGGFEKDVYEWVQNNGIMSESQYPYEKRQSTCRYVDSEKVTSCKGIHRVTSGSEIELKSELATAGPLSVSIYATLPSFKFYEKGIYFDDRCRNELKYLNHAVLAVGYGSENGEDYWIVKNSWSSDWGEGGYVRMARSRDNHCGVATDAMYPLL